MLNQHYLDPMFPLSKRQNQASKAKKDNVGEKLDEAFLDRIVTPDEKLAMQRYFTAIADMGVMKHESGLEFGSGQVLKYAYGQANGSDADVDECLTFQRTTSDRVVAEEAKGKTVKELSRLWKYLGGKSPMDHDHIENGYHDELIHEHRKNHHYHHNQQTAAQEPGDEPFLGQQQSPISSLFDRQKSPFPHPRPTDEQFFHVSSFSDPFVRRSRGDLS